MRLSSRPLRLFLLFGVIVVLALIAMSILVAFVPWLGQWHHIYFDL